VPINAKHPMPDPEDNEGWARIKAAVDAHYAAGIKGFAGSLGASVEPVQLGDTVVHVATPEAAAIVEGAYLDLHGGALVFGGGEACRVGAQMQADLHGVHCYGVDYRTPPEHPYPTALDDTLAAYVHVLERHKPSDVVVGGRSAVGNLAVAMLLQAREAGLPLPAGLVLLSPEVDLTESGDSFAVNRLVDLMLPLPQRSANLLYANDANLSDPALSPLFGDLTGLPPTLLQSGTRDLFLSNTVRIHRALRKAGVPAGASRLRGDAAWRLPGRHAGGSGAERRTRALRPRVLARRLRPSAQLYDRRPACRRAPRPGRYGCRSTPWPVLMRCRGGVPPRQKSSTRRDPRRVAGE
jgi:acetyl esterase/lipase